MEAYMIILWVYKCLSTGKYCNGDLLQPNPYKLLTFQIKLSCVCSFAHCYLSYLCSCRSQSIYSILFYYNKPLVSSCLNPHERNIEMRASWIACWVATTVMRPSTVCDVSQSSKNHYIDTPSVSAPYPDMKVIKNSRRTRRTRSCQSCR